MSAVYKKFIFLFFILMIFGSCGEKAGPNLALQFFYPTDADNPFNNTSVNYVLFQVDCIPRSDGKCPDVNKDGKPDSYGFPSTCVKSDGTPNYACGFPPAQASFELSGIPLEFQFKVTTFFTDLNGAILYQGSSATEGFLNTATAIQPILVTVIKK